MTYTTVITQKGEGHNIRVLILDFKETNSGSQGLDPDSRWALQCASGFLIPFHGVVCLHGVYQVSILCLCRAVGLHWSSLYFISIDPCVPKRKQIKRQQKTNQRYKANSKHQNKTGLTGLTRGVSHGGPSRAKEDYIQRGFLSHGVSFDRLQSSLSPRVTGDAVQYMEPQEKSTNQERPWPIISGPSYHQITDLSLQFGFTQLLPGNSSNYVTFEALQYFNSAHAQSSFPQLSLEDVNRELKSCDMPSQSMTSYDDDDVEHQQTSMITAIANNCVHDVTMATYLGFENSNQGNVCRIKYSAISAMVSYLGLLFERERE